GTRTYQALEVAGDQVDLEVDDRSFPVASGDRVLQRVRDEGAAERARLVVHAGDGQAGAVDRDRALLGDVAGELLWQLDGQLPSLLSLADLDYLRRSIDVALDKVTVERAGQGKSGLQVDGVAGLEAPQVGPLDGLGDDVGVKAAAPDLDHGQAGAVDRHAGADLGLRRDRRRLDAEAALALLGDAAELANDPGEHRR